MNGAGYYNSRIRVEKRATGVDALNQPLDSWEPVISTWANVRGQNGSESITAGVDTPKERLSFRVRQKRTVTLAEGMRIVYKGGNYIVTRVLHDRTAGEWTDLVAETT